MFLWRISTPRLPIEIWNCFKLSKLLPELLCFWAALLPCSSQCVQRSGKSRGGTLVHSTIVHCGTLLWYTALWYTTVVHYTVVHWCGILLWHTAVHYFGTQWYTSMEHCSLPHRVLCPPPDRAGPASPLLWIGTPHQPFQILAHRFKPPSNPCKPI